MPRWTAGERLPTTGHHASVVVRTLFCGGIWLAAMCCAPSFLRAQDMAGAHANPSSANEPDYTELSLEELLNIEVVSVAGVGQKWVDTPAAMFVITAQDIRRSGHKSIPELLRMVPGIHVAQITSNIYAVSSRGLGSRFTDNLLVLIDGRAVYNDIFAGVFWDEHELLLEDIDRIEVIRGPGATLWGANAVNGVINIVTRRASETQGTLITAGTGTFEDGFTSVRYGSKLSEALFYRVYGKYLARNNLDYLSDVNAHDDWNQARGGFRLDFEPPGDWRATLSGDAYIGRVQEPTFDVSLTAPFNFPVRDSTPTQGGNILGRVEWLEAGDVRWTLQAFADRASRHYRILDVAYSTYDVELRHNVTLGERHAFVLGAGYRYRADQTDGGLKVAFSPASRRLEKLSFFVQDAITLIPDRLTLMAGTKVENNTFTGVELQPGARLLWEPCDSQSLWAAVSRAVRTPSRAENDLVFTSTVLEPPAVPSAVAAQIAGNGSVDSEVLCAYEAGYRIAPTSELSFDLAVFYNQYNDVLTSAGTTANPFVFTYLNDTEADAYGFELTSSWQATETLAISPSYSWLKLDLRGSTETREKEAPENQVKLRSNWQVRPNLDAAAAAYYTDHIRTLAIPSYVRIDCGLTWKPAPGIELSLWGKNLSDRRHEEGLDSSFILSPLEIERSVYVELQLRF